MSEENSGGDKQFEPSQKKLEDARKKGDVPRSAEFATACAYAGFALVAMTYGGALLSNAGQSLKALLVHGLADEGGMLAVLRGGGIAEIARALGIAFMPWFAIPALAALAAFGGQRAVTWAPNKLGLKLERISVLANARNKFGRQGLFEFAKSAAKLFLFSLVLALVSGRQIAIIPLTPGLEPGPATAFLFQSVETFIRAGVALMLLVGIADLLWQRAEFRRRQRMSRKELTDEQKEMEGDPQLRQQRRQRGYDIATNRMLADVPTADVVIVNPQHYSVALKWSRKKSSAPICVAKGVDEIAARIREIASRSGVPIRRDPPTARALYSSVKIGEEIWPEHYAAVAVAIRFADRIRMNAREARSDGY